MAQNILYRLLDLDGKKQYSARKVERYDRPGFPEISKNIAYISPKGKITLSDGSVTAEEMEDIHKFAQVIKNNSDIEDETNA